MIATAQECFDAAQVAVGEAVSVDASEGSSDALATGCTITYDGTVGAKAFFNTKTTKQCCGADVLSLEGKATSLVHLEMAVTYDTVTITLTGPSNVWFGVGFFAQAMEDKPYAIIIDGAGAVSERQLATHMGAAASPAGTLLSPSVRVVSSAVAGGRRTVALTRPAVGATSMHATFTMQQLKIPFINAIGSR